MRVQGEQLRAQRRKRRGELGLEDRSLTDSTRQRYYLAVRRVLPLIEADKDTLDNILTRWIEHIYHEGEGITVASDALCGLQHYMPSCRGELKQSWRLFRIWRKIEKPKQAPPLPLLVFLGILGRAIETDALAMAAMLALGFWGMLRTGELMKLQRRHLLFSTENMVLQLGRTKTGLRRAIDENVVIYQEVPRLIVESLLTTLPMDPATPLWDGSAQLFRTQFATLLTYFRVHHLFRPYSLRRGGATEDFRQHGLMERTLLKGRWGTSTAARHYVQEGLSVLTSLKVDPSAHRLLRSYVFLYFHDLPEVRSAPGIVETAGGPLLKKGRNCKRK